MKVLQVAPYFYPHIGGVESYVQHLSKALIKRGHEVAVVTSNLGNAPREVVDGIEVIRVKPLFTLFTTPVMPAVQKVIKSLEADVVHANLPPPLTAYYAGKASKATSRPYILTYHCDVELQSVWGKAVVSVYRHTLGRRTVAMADRLILTTKSYGATSRDVWRHTPEVIPNAVDTQLFNPDVDGSEIREKYGLGDRAVVLYVGRLVYHKGLEYLIQAARNVDAAFLIVGEGNMMPVLRDEIERLDVRNVIFTGRVDERELPKYYAACDLFVLPSVRRLEAFGIVTLEAFSSGRPAVVSDIPGVREIVDEGVDGLHAEPMNAKDLADKINTLLSDKNKLREMGKKAREKVLAEYSWERIAERVEAIYRDVLEGN